VREFHSGKKKAACSVAAADGDTGVVVKSTADETELF
jgi:hypothetical protein